jgi:hypothetical protein
MIVRNFVHTMIVRNCGYKALKDLDIKDLYYTSRKTYVAVEKGESHKMTLYLPRYDKLEWKLTEGKRICEVEKVIDMTENVNQVIVYKPY